MINRFNFSEALNASLLHRYDFIQRSSLHCRYFFTENHCLMLHHGYFFKEIHRLLLHHRYPL
jgi:hypothetical protein